VERPSKCVAFKIQRGGHRETKNHITNHHESRLQTDQQVKKKKGKGEEPGKEQRQGGLFVVGVREKKKKN